MIFALFGKALGASPVLFLLCERKRGVNNVRVKNYTRCFYRITKSSLFKNLIHDAFSSLRSRGLIDQSSTLQTRQAFFPQPFARRREDLALEAFAVAFADDKLQLLAFPIGHFSTRA